MKLLDFNFKLEVVLIKLWNMQKKHNNQSAIHLEICLPLQD